MDGIMIRNGAWILLTQTIPYLFRAGEHGRMPHGNAECRPFHRIDFASRKD